MLKKISLVLALNMGLGAGIGGFTSVAQAGYGCITTCLHENTACEVSGTPWHICDKFLTRCLRSCQP